MNSRKFTPVVFAARPCKALRHVAVLCLALLLLPASLLRAGTIYVPNFSFESPGTDYAYPGVDSWQTDPQPDGFDTNLFGQWYQFVGVFANTTNGSPDHLVNCEGNQALYIFTYPQAGIFQDYNSIGGSDASPSHAFNAKYEVGKSYQLKVGVTSSYNEPLSQGAMLQIALYYRDVSNNIVNVSSTLVTFDTNVFTNLDQLIDFQITVPGVNATDAWAGQNIGIHIQSAYTPDFQGAWDIDNVRLTEAVNVPNFSFESPSTDYAYPGVDSWQTDPQPDTFDTNTFGPWYQFVGVFANTTNGSPDHLVNCDGNQAIYIFTYPQAGFFQDYNSIGGSDVTPSHAFNAKYEVGKSYQLTVGVTSSYNEPLSPGDILELSLYYRDASNNIANVASTMVTFDTNVFTNLDQLLDFQVTVPGVKATDAWAGQNIGIQIQSAYTPDYNGVWDVDNVRLVDTVAPALSQLSVTNGQFNFTLVSEPGRAFNILASPAINTPGSNWVSLTTLTNTTGTAQFTDTSTNFTQRFYRAQGL